MAIVPRNYLDPAARRNSILCQLRKDALGLLIDSLTKEWPVLFSKERVRTINMLSKRPVVVVVQAPSVRLPISFQVPCNVWGS